VRNINADCSWSSPRELCTPAEFVLQLHERTRRHPISHGSELLTRPGRRRLLPRETGSAGSVAPSRRVDDRGALDAVVRPWSLTA